MTCYMPLNFSIYINIKSYKIPQMEKQEHQLPLNQNTKTEYYIRITHLPCFIKTGTIHHQPT